MQRGLLTGKFTHQRMAVLSDDDHRRRSPDFHEPHFSATIELVEKLEPIAQRHGRTPAQLAISWVLRRSEVTSAIVGARRPSQIEETAPAADWVLDTGEIDQIERLLDERLEKNGAK
jgi:aryl-alcohol dehydrogenase-like predicted oxidoreductase